MTILYAMELTLIESESGDDPFAHDEKLYLSTSVPKGWANGQVSIIHLEKPPEVGKGQIEKFKTNNCFWHDKVYVKIGFLTAAKNWTFQFLFTFLDFLCAKGQFNFECCYCCRHRLGTYFLGKLQTFFSITTVSLNCEVWSLLKCIKLNIW